MDNQSEPGPPSSHRPLSLTGCDSEMVGEKRGGDELDEEEERPRKQVKMRDLESVMLSSGMNTHDHDTQRNKEVSDQSQGGGENVARKTQEFLPVDLGGNDQLEGGRPDRSKNYEVLVPADMGGSGQSQQVNFEMLKVTETTVTVISDATEAGKSGGEISGALVKKIPKALDLNTKVGVATNTVDDDIPVSDDNFRIPVLTEEQDGACNNKTVALSGASLEFNSENIASSRNQDPFHYFKRCNQLKVSEVSESGSTTGSQQEKDSHRLWQQMKQNGFLSSSLGGVPISMPNQHGRKTKGDTDKKRMDISKKEQVDRFTKIATPSDLLSELNPGIINHVRNKKQVYSIIKALVKSEKRENSRIQANRQVTQMLETKKLATERISTAQCTSMEKSLPYMPGNISGGNDSSRADSEDDTLELKLSSATEGQQNFSSLPHEESANLSLSVKAANVAFQWLGLLHQDIKGRLAALQRSKKRVRATITTELPLLVSKEISYDHYHFMSSAAMFQSNSAAEMHKAKWGTLFSKMDQSLAEEERQLDNWLYQVNIMQRHCEEGLQQFPWTLPHGFQHSGASVNESGSSIMDRLKEELAIRAAAASIYSTSNFLSSNENFSC